MDCIALVTPAGTGDLAQGAADILGIAVIKEWIDLPQRIECISQIE